MHLVFRLSGSGPEKMAHSVKQLPSKQEDLNFIPTTQIKKSRYVGLTCNPSAKEVDTGGTLELDG